MALQQAISSGSPYNIIKSIADFYKLALEPIALSALRTELQNLHEERFESLTAVLHVCVEEKLLTQQAEAILEEFAGSDDVPLDTRLGVLALSNKVWTC